MGAVQECFLPYRRDVTSVIEFINEVLRQIILKTPKNRIISMQNIFTILDSCDMISYL